MRKTFIFYADRQDYIQEMTLEETGLFLKTILKYQNGIDIGDIGIIKFIRPRVKKQLDADNEKREQESKKRSEAGIEGNRKRRGEPKKSQKIAKHSKSSQRIASATKTSQLIPDNVNDNETVNDNINKEILPNGSNSGAEIIPDYSPETITIQINELIKEIKQTAQSLSIAYDKTKEREFAKHLLTANEYGTFCENVGLDRKVVAVNILRASVIKNYRRGPAAGPKAIYQNYAEIYNLSKTDKNKTIDLTPYLTNGQSNQSV